MILEFKNEYRWLSNFAPVKVELDGVVYPSVENAYQAGKTLDEAMRKQFVGINAYEAKQLGKRVVMRPDWDQVKLLLMTELCRQKYNQEPYRSKLIATGDQEIQEGNWWGDTYWGVCRGVGHNHLGKIIMHLRSLM